MLIQFSRTQLLFGKEAMERLYNARVAATKLAEATGADCVQVIGSKFVLYLQKKKDSAYAALLK